MQLKVEIGSWCEDGLEIGEVITSFDDAEKIGARVGRAVRDFIRRTPMTRGGAHTRIDVVAYYTEREPRAPSAQAKKRRKKKAEADGAES